MDGYCGAQHNVSPRQGWAIPNGFGERVDLLVNRPKKGLLPLEQIAVAWMHPPIPHSYSAAAQ
jgi:hypothetical protein